MKSITYAMKFEPLDEKFLDSCRRKFQMSKLKPAKPKLRKR